MTTNAAILALRAVSYNRGVTGKTIGMLGICDTIEEYLGVDREKFVKEIVKTNVILDGAIKMWHKIVNKVNMMHYNANNISYDEMVTYDSYYMELYDLYGENGSVYDKQFMKEYVRFKAAMNLSDEDPYQAAHYDYMTNMHTYEQEYDDYNDYDY